MSTMPNRNAEDADRWLAQATEHFNAADWTAQGRFWPEACFQFQQAGELALKALLIRGGERVRLHSLSHLAELLRPSYPDIDRLAEHARSLDRFYIPTRYPDALPVGTSGQFFNEQHAVEARAAAHEITAYVRQKLANP